MPLPWLFDIILYFDYAAHAAFALYTTHAFRSHAFFDDVTLLLIILLCQMPADEYSFQMLSFARLPALTLPASWLIGRHFLSPPSCR